MDPASLLLKKTIPAELAENKKALDVLAKGSLKHNPIQFLPFKAIGDVRAAQDEKERPFLLSSYNQTDKPGCFRSPTTNRVFMVQRRNIFVSPKIDVPPIDELEIFRIQKVANEIWGAYVHLYYGAEGIGSVFLKLPSKGSRTFEGLYGVQKKSDRNGTWDCAHIVHVDEPKGSKCAYRVESAVMLKVLPYRGARMSSTLNRETVKTMDIRPHDAIGSHLSNLGKIIEEVEIDFRSKLERVDLPKTLEIMDSVYKPTRDSISASAVTDMDEREEPMNLTGMSVNAALIGQIANKALAKMEKGSSFLDVLKQKEKERAEQIQATGDSSNGHYADLRNNLKKSQSVPARQMLPIHTPEFQGKAGLRKSTINVRQPIKTQPTPEWMDFRNKLKKTG